MCFVLDNYKTLNKKGLCAKVDFKLGTYPKMNYVGPKKTKHRQNKNKGYIL